MNILNKKVLVVTLVLMFLCSFVIVRANDGESIVDRIMLAYLQLKVATQTQSAEFGEMLGSAGGMLAENYIPYVMYNGGYNSNKPIETGDTLTVDGASTLTGAVGTGALTVTGAASVSGTLSADGGATISELVTYEPTAVATTTDVASTMTEAEMLAGQYYTVNINTQSDFTWTLPASTTFSTLLQNTGNRYSMCFDNATSSAYSLIFAAGTGIDLQSSTSTLSVFQTDQGCLSFTRKADTDIHAIFSPTVNSD